MSEDCPADRCVYSARQGNPTASHITRRVAIQSTRASRSSELSLNHGQGVRSPSSRTDSRSLGKRDCALPSRMARKCEPRTLQQLERKELCFC